MLPVLDSITYAAEECVFCGCGIECPTNICYNTGTILCFNSDVSLLIFCLHEVTTDESGVLKSPTIIGPTGLRVYIYGLLLSTYIFDHYIFLLN